MPGPSVASAALAEIRSSFDMVGFDRADEPFQKTA